MVVNMNKKHVSRKLKSAWRKHIDISDVDQFLEEQRQDERIGGRIADKPDRELFSEEKRPAKVKATLRELRRNKFGELPRSLLPLVNTSNVSDPVVKRNVKKSRVTLAPVAPVASVRFRKRGRPSGIAKPAQEDLWAKETPVPGELQNEWIAKELVHHTLAHTGKPLVTNLPARMDPEQRRVPLRKRLPAEGLSYNPAIDDYLELKDKLVKEEKKIIRHEEHLDRVLTSKLGKMTPEERYRTAISEMSEGLLKPDKKNEPEEEEDEKKKDEEEEEKPVVVAKAKKRISKAKKRARMLQHKEEKLLEQELHKLVEIDRVEEIAAEVEQEVQQTQRKAEYRVRKRKAMRTKLDLPIDFVEPEKLSGSLRTIEPLNNLLATGLPKVRKVSILKRTRAEVERKMRRIPTKRYTRSSHKEPMLPPTKPAKRAK
ncbi:ribosome biogenesis protein NOP53 [Anopheles merus]|uniref:Ribosome biogenesis protein NOP53 n=1 Tax=Anopheles merus TaxID=30066 RepID=A0A182VGY0_ANOME|nr:ribosome biogenesis protein NOP53 [Anopheles merus]